MHLGIHAIDFGLFNKLKTKNSNGLIHSIYSRVINISFQDSSELFSIAISNVIQSPSMMQTEDIEKFIQLVDSIEVGDAVERTKTNQFRIGMFVVDWSTASTWNHQLKVITADKSKINDRLNILTEYLPTISNNNQLVKALLKEEIEHTDYFALKYQQIFNELKQQATPEKFSELIGLGLGLTPSGDDFFVGCFSVLSVYNKKLAQKFKTNHNFSLAHLQARTTQVSFNMVLQALEGNVNAELYHLILDPELSQNTITNIQKIGSTSGTDMLAGAYFGYYLLVKQYKEEIV